MSTVQTTAIVVVGLAMTAAVAELRNEVLDLKKQIPASGDSAAAAVRQFEKDFFARMNGEAIARQNVLAQQQAQRNAAIQQGLNGLPMKNLGQPVPWGRD
jgi:hypothetical protein